MDKVTAIIVRFMVFLSRFAGLLAKLGLVEYDHWQVGKKLRILLIGYNGERNTGADVRVAAIVDQFEALLGKENIEINILTQNIENFKIYFADNTRLTLLSSIFFMDVLKACCRTHMTVLCEGSTLKSKFANALTLFFLEGAGIMKAQKKPCLAYGSEAGEMDGFIRNLAQKYCSETYFLARTGESLKIIRELGMNGHLGTDTAWTFQGADPSQQMATQLKKEGWDGQKPLLGIAVINPFWWPIKPSLSKLGKAILTENWDYHSKKWYFYSWSAERKRLYQNYLQAIADAVNDERIQTNFFPVIIGMEALDRQACDDFNQLLAIKAPLFVSSQYDGYQITGLLRSLSFLITSRYHAGVLSMETFVPAIAVSMDERLENIFSELSLKEEYLLKVDDEELNEKLPEALAKLIANRDGIALTIKQKLPDYYRKMNEMGDFFQSYVREKFPEYNQTKG